MLRCISRHCVTDWGFTIYWDVRTHILVEVLRRTASFLRVEGKPRKQPSRHRRAAYTASYSSWPRNPSSLWRLQSSTTRRNVVSYIFRRNLLLEASAPAGLGFLYSVHTGCGAHPASNLMGTTVPPLPRTSTWHAIFPFILTTYFPRNRVTLYSKLLSGPRNAVCPSVFPTKILYTFLVSCYLSIIAYPAKSECLIGCASENLELNGRSLMEM
jgi:hypothetical protein